MSKEHTKVEYLFLIPIAVAIITVIATLHILGFQKYLDITQTSRQNLIESHFQILTSQGAFYIENFETELLHNLQQSVLQKKNVHELKIVNMLADEQYGSIEIKTSPDNIKKYDLPIILDNLKIGSFNIIYNLDEEIESKNQTALILIGSFLLSASIILASLWLLYRSQLKRSHEEQLHQKAITQQKFALDQHSIVTATDLEFIVIYVNDSFCEASGYKSDEVLGKKSCVLEHLNTKEIQWDDVIDIISKGLVWHGEIENETKQGERYWTDTTVVPFLNENEKVESYIFIQTDISQNKKMQEDLKVSVNDLEKNKIKLTNVLDDFTEQNIILQTEVAKRRQAQEQLNKMALYDELTNLPNRTLLKKEAAKALNSAKRHERQCAIMFLDLDGFKSVNDNNNHDIGDAVLVETAIRIQDSVRDIDTVGRYGGDEFIIILPECALKEDIDIIAQRIIDLVQQEFESVNIKERVSASIGISIYPKDGDTYETLFISADKAMYEAKKSGKNRYTYS